MARTVATLTAFFRDPYRPGSGPVVQPWIAPERRTLITFRKLWPILSLGVICGVLVIATLPLQKDMTGFLAAVGIAAAYAFFSAVFYLWEQRSTTSSLHRQQNLRGLRKIAMIAGLTATLWFLPTASPEVWLLYLIPMLTIGVDLDRRWALTLITMTMVLMFASAFPQSIPGLAPSQLLTDGRDGVMRALVGGYVGLTSYLLARCLAYQYRASSEAVRRLLVAPNTQRWLNTVDVVAALIADLFSEKDSPIAANVLIFDPEKGKTRLAGSSLPEGQRLANTEFTFPATQGVTSWAAVHNEACFLNDTEHDPERRFLPNAAFPKTRSALAVPFPLGGRQRAVLEIESPMPHNIAYEDLQLMELIAGYLAGAHQASEWIEFHRQLAELGQDLADRIIHVQEIGATLVKIGEVALEMFDADVIGFYYCDLQTGLIEERCIVGHLLTPEVSGSPVNTPDSLVYQLMQQGEPQFFGNALGDEQLTRRGLWHREHAVEPFVVREKIVACSAIPLVLGKERLGLMWVNYRQAQDFPKPLQYGLQMVAPFAALAIKSGIQSAQAERERREKLHRDLHDSLSARLNNAARALDRLSFCPPGSERWKETLQLVQLSVKWATTVVSALLGKQEWMTLQSIVADLRTHADVSTRIYGVQVQLHAAEMPPVSVNHAGGNELLFACNEAINNALCHAHASMVAVSVCVENDNLCIAVCDDGVGFDPAALTRVNGINNMRARVEQSLSGSMTLVSVPGVGTNVTLVVPLSNAGEERKNGNGATE